MHNHKIVRNDTYENILGYKDEITKEKDDFEISL
jgi:hypothetical protein